MGWTSRHQEKIVADFNWSLRNSPEVCGSLFIEAACFWWSPSGERMVVQTINFYCTWQRTERGGATILL